MREDPEEQHEPDNRRELDDNFAEKSNTMLEVGKRGSAIGRDSRVQTDIVMIS